MEGSGRERNVIVQWPDADAAMAFYSSPAYTEALTHAGPSSTRDYVIVEGV